MTVLLTAFLEDNMQRQIAIEMRNITKSFGDKKANENVNLQVYEFDR